MRGSTKLLLAVLLLVGGPFYWLLIDNSHGKVPEVRLDIAAIRAEAARIPGAAPTSIDFELVSMRRMPGGFIAAGTGLKRRMYSAMAFRLNTPDGPILIDSGVTGAQCQVVRCEFHFPERQQLIEKALESARLILFTGEDLDHMGGFLASPAWSQLAPKAVLTSQQGPGGALARALPWPRDRSALAPLRPDAPLLAVAPGVVSIAAPGHGPGSRMIFVRLQNGREFLFAGDVAPNSRNLLRQRAGSRLLTDWVRPESRAMQIGWLRAIRDLRKQDPALFIVPGHDPDFLLLLRNGRPLKLHFDETTNVPTGLSATDDDDDS